MRQPLAGLILAIGFLSCTSPAQRDGSPAEAPTTGRVQVTPDVVYGHKVGMALTLDVYRPAAANGAAILFINSGGFVSGQLRQCESTGWRDYAFVPAAELHLEGQREIIPLLSQFSFEPLLTAGFTVFDVRHGGSPCFKLPEIVSDVHDAVRFIRKHDAEFGVDCGRLGLWGASAGGYLALMAAFSQDGDSAEADQAQENPCHVRAVAAYYPAGFDLAGDAKRFPELIANLPALQVGAATLDSLSLRHYISPEDPPALIIYGAEDFPFITEPSESVCAALTRNKVECRKIVVPGVGHEFRGRDGYHPEAGEQASREIVAWFKETLIAR